MNLALVLTGLGFFRESRVLKGILLVISLCTFIMTASSAYRMLLYIGAYYLTFLRIFVLWALAVIALLMAGIVGKTLKNRFPLFRYGLCVITVCYLVLSYSRPDYWIARYNISVCLEQRAEDTEMGRDLDIRYLSGLSADAAPVIMPLNGEMERTEDNWYNYYITRHAERAEEMSLRSYNFSRGYVKRMLAGRQGNN